MERLTEWYDNGLREGVLVKEKRGEKEIKVLFEEVDDGYHAMCTLKAYEDTGLTPEQIREIDRLYAEKCREVTELRQQHGTEGWANRMNDLISRKMLIENLKKFAPEHYSALVNDLIMKQPTVFDPVFQERKHMNDGWIPVERRFPDNAEYILLSFTNFSLPMIGRYEEDPEGGAFYLGDCDENDTCISMNLFVNAWRPLPEPYCPEAKASERKQEWKERMLQNFMKKGEK